MLLPKQLRGHYYPSETTVSCRDFRECLICFKCFRYSPSRQRCVKCESRLVPMDDGEAPKKVCDHRKKPDIILDAKLLVERFRDPIYHPDRIARPSIQMQHESKEQKEMENALGELREEYQVLVEKFDD